ncbi:MAG: hypothetical protein ACNYPG_02035 [Candidatus Porifericomitaceae bacterium WSBS_2022_MAG_OTU9]
MPVLPVVSLLLAVAIAIGALAAIAVSPNLLYSAHSSSQRTADETLADVAASMASRVAMFLELGQQKLSDWFTGAALQNVDIVAVDSLVATANQSAAATLVELGERLGGDWYIDSVAENPPEIASAAEPELAANSAEFVFAAEPQLAVNSAEFVFAGEPQLAANSAELVSAAEPQLAANSAELVSAAEPQLAANSAELVSAAEPQLAANSASLRKFSRACICRCQTTACRKFSRAVSAAEPQLAANSAELVSAAEPQLAANSAELVSAAEPQLAANSAELVSAAEPQLASDSTDGILGATEQNIFHGGKAGESVVAGQDVALVATNESFEDVLLESTVDVNWNVLKKLESPQPARGATDQPIYTAHGTDGGLSFSNADAVGEAALLPWWHPTSVWRHSAPPNVAATEDFDSPLQGASQSPSSRLAPLLSEVSSPAPARLLGLGELSPLVLKESKDTVANNLL